MKPTSLVVRVLLPALLLCASNALKPPIVDDPAFVAIARQIASAPTDPYGFEFFWYQQPQPASEVLAPPVLLYWLAASMGVLGGEPAAWKWGLLPFALLLTGALADLARRLAPEHATPVVWMAVVSPALLPNFNLMLDVPALALGLAALAWSLRACDRGSGFGALGAGCLAALSMQTKYTGVVFALAALSYLLLHRHWRLALILAVAAALPFLAWEGFVATSYGNSQLLSASSLGGRGVVHTGVGLLCLLGATSPVLGLLALAARGVAPMRLVVAGSLAALPFVWIPFLRAAPVSSDYLPAGEHGAGVEGLGFAALGIGVLVALGGCVHALLLRARTAREEKPHDATFLLIWLAIQLVAFSSLSPFLASRRVLGLFVVALFVIAHAASNGRARRAGVSVVAVWGIALGLLYGIADLSDARARARALPRALHELSERRGAPTARATWFTGHWGFQLQAERAGLRAVVPGVSQLELGDWLLVPTGVKRQHIWLQTGALEHVARVRTRSAFPWSSIPSAYIGRLPLRPQADAQLLVDLYRATRDFVPAAGTPKTGS